jgi:prepilin-type N-terminal cleavage/methylation domain-containing protein
MQNHKGFSLVEAVVALAVASLIALSAAALYRASGQGASQARSADQPVAPRPLRAAPGTVLGNLRPARQPRMRQQLLRRQRVPRPHQDHRPLCRPGVHLPGELPPPGRRAVPAVDGGNPQKVYPGRGSVIFEFYDANGNRIYSSGTPPGWRAWWQGPVKGAGSAAATFTMPTGGGGQSAAYSRQIPSSARDDVVCALVVMSDNHGDFMIWTYIRVSDLPYYTVIEVADTPWGCNDREPIYRGD